MRLVDPDMPPPEAASASDERPRLIVTSFNPSLHFEQLLIVGEFFCVTREHILQIIAWLNNPRSQILSYIFLLHVTVLKVL